MAGGIRYRLQRTLQVARGLRLRDSWSRKGLNLSYQFPNEVRLERGVVELTSLGVKVPKSSFEFILDSYPHLRNLRHRLNAKFYFERGLFFVLVGDIKLNPTTAEEVFIASEIFLAGTYQFVTRGQFVVVDIGMNVGFAALFFAAKPEVSKVYCFEPFKSTFDQAIRNFENNPILSDKIQCFNYGLNDVDRHLTVDFNYENKGQLGIHGTTLILGEVGPVDKADIVLKEACAELGNILARHPNEDLIVKLDCEGAEYAIVRNLFANDLLRHIRILCIEWHENGPNSLVEILATSGFSVFSQRSPAKNVGMIYAIR